MSPRASPCWTRPRPRNCSTSSRLQVLLEASAKPESALGLALATAIVEAADQTFKDVIGDAIRKRDAIDAWTQRAGSVDKAMAELSKAFGLDATDTLASVEQEYFSKSLIPAAEWPALIEILRIGSKSDANHIAALKAAQASRRPRADRQLSEGVLHHRAGTAQEHRHQETRRQAARLAGAARRRARRACAS